MCRNKPWFESKYMAVTIKAFRIIRHYVESEVMIYLEKHSKAFVSWLCVRGTLGNARLRSLGQEMGLWNTMALIFLNRSSYWQYVCVRYVWRTEKAFYLSLLLLALTFRAVTGRGATKLQFGRFVGIGILQSLLRKRSSNMSFVEVIVRANCLFRAPHNLIYLELV